MDDAILKSVCLRFPTEPRTLVRCFAICTLYRCSIEFCLKGEISSGNICKSGRQGMDGLFFTSGTSLPARLLAYDPVTC
jgi:hypothetical protein